MMKTKNNFKTGFPEEIDFEDNWSSSRTQCNCLTRKVSSELPICISFW